ncbi:hypothetical protein AKJ39_00530 [candidate division MSBL1 archaeon SCGC-AAA259J03]|uniref:DUF434 domain-containing protein n=1 Tax=candidate division MSBL1 archaeon SCGC-AAA259J03 TaxID=1698269 RepID=A0A656YZS0_9EURY|nr:hypothetical protein AKJ39_00530 [candidate division MSBL1 archaeon SCGC-AAA259J03]
MLESKTVKAIHDLRYLLNRGYPRDSAVEFVSDHYLLEIDKRHLLTRCVFPKKEIKNHRKRLINSEQVSGREVGIDGYNVLITVETILNGGKTILCDDGLIRDLEAIFGKYKMSDSTEDALSEILNVLQEMKPEKVVFFFDKQVSKSGELAGLTRRRLDEMGINGDSRTAAGTDAKVWEFEISASSDRVIINKSEKILDIPSEILKKKDDATVIDLSRT